MRENNMKWEVNTMVNLNIFLFDNFVKYQDFNFYTLGFTF